MAFSLLPLVFIYPFCKRFTYWPQVILGAAFNWGMLISWTEIQGKISLSAFLMWFGAIAWQIGYDTVYAYIDYKDDKQIGIKSTALLFGENGKLYIGFFYTISVVSWLIFGWLESMSKYYTTGILAITIHMAWQISNISTSTPKNNFNVFTSNVHIGIALAFSSYLGTI